MKPADKAFIDALYAFAAEEEWCREDAARVAVILTRVATHLRPDAAPAGVRVHTTECAKVVDPAADCTCGAPLVQA